MDEDSMEDPAAELRGCASLLSLFSEASMHNYPPSLKTLKSQNSLGNFSESLKNLGVEEVDDEGYCSDGDEEEESVAPISPTTIATPESDAIKSEGNSFYKTASFAISMSQYAMRRTMIKDQIDEGQVFSSYTPGNTPSKLDQVNFDLYSFENQLERRKIKKNKKFTEIVEKLWSCVDLLKDEDGNLTKEAYLVLTVKITLLMVPPPIDMDRAREGSTQDWENDSTNNRMTFQEFFLAIFTLVDVWCETVVLNDYIEILLRLIEGITFNENKTLRFKSDEQIKYDEFFSFLGGLPDKTDPSDIIKESATDKTIEEEEAEEEPKLSVEVPPPSEPTTSALVKESSSTTKKKKKKGDNKLTLLSLAQTNTFIAKLYSEKQKNDEFREMRHKGDGEPKLIRFDKFIMKFFKQLHGTRGIARRHLRTFVISVQHLSDQHPRIELFRLCSGIPSLSTGSGSPQNHDYSPLIVTRFVIPFYLHIATANDSSGSSQRKRSNASETATVPKKKSLVGGSPIVNLLADGRDEVTTLHSAIVSQLGLYLRGILWSQVRRDGDRSNQIRSIAAANPIPFDLDLPSRPSRRHLNVVSSSCHRHRRRRRRRRHLTHTENFERFERNYT